MLLLLLLSLLLGLLLLLLPKECRVLVRARRRVHVASDPVLLTGGAPGTTSRRRHRVLTLREYGTRYLLHGQMAGGIGLQVRVLEPELGFQVCHVGFEARWEA